MIVVDSSVLLAIELAEPKGAACVAALEAHRHDLVMSTVNLAEVLIRVGDRRPAAVAPLARRLETSGITFVPPDFAQAAIAADARLRFPLNLGDCFAYALAVTREGMILTLDGDFEATDRPVVMPGC